MPGQSAKERDELFESLYATQQSEELKTETKKTEVSDSKEEKEEPSASDSAGIESKGTESKEVHPETTSVKKEEKEEEKESLIPESEEKSDKKQGDLKSALHESRQKLREYKKETEDKINQLSAELSLLKSQMTAKPKEEELSEYSTDEEKRISELNKTIKEQEQMLKDIDEWRKSQVQAEQRRTKDAELAELLSDIKSVSSDLDKEKFPGFDRFYYLVSAKLKEMPEAERLEMDTKDGWKTLYKEIFPSLKSVFIAEDIDSKMSKKQEAKKAMDMLSETKSGGKSSDTPYTVEEYFKLRGARI